MRFSVIVPVYNSQQYIRQCIESVLSQDYFDFEVVLVDDCSSDESFLICEDYCNRDARCHLERHENNMGASAARNTGLSYATGDYILFLDNDDWWESTDALSSLERVIVEQNSPDLICFPMGEFRNGLHSPNLPVFKIPESSFQFASYEDKMQYLITNGLFYSSACGKAVKSSLIAKSGLQFETCLHHNEDSEWSRRLLCEAGSVGWLSSAFYVYRRNSSVSQSTLPDADAVADSIGFIIDSQMKDMQFLSNSCKRLSAAFCAYLYIILLSYIGMSSSARRKTLIRKYESSKCLLRFSERRIVKAVRVFCSAFGLKLTAFVLSNAMKIEQHRIAAQ